MTNHSTDISKPASGDAAQDIALSRLRQRREFLFVQHNGVRQVTPHFILQAAIPAPRPCASSSPATARHIRTGLTASKKVGNAVIRNRAKRRMRALVGQLGQMQTPSQADYVLVARHSLVNADWTVLCADFTMAVGKVNRKLLATAKQE